MIAPGRPDITSTRSAQKIASVMLWVMSPHFYGDVIGQRPIQMGLAMLGGWMFIGNMIMRRMIDMRI